MARSSSGRSVARAAATGGGATYRGQMPVNWYAALVVIVLLGAGSVALARYHYGQTAPATQPIVGQTWHAGLAFDVCGKIEPALAASPQSATTGLTTTGDGVLLIAPKSSGEAGNNATVGKFASEYTGLTLKNSVLKYPSAPELKNGDKCPAGTPDAGQKGVVKARSWVLPATSTGSGHELKQVGGAYVQAPAGLKLQNRGLIVVGFVPASASLPKVPGTTTVALLQAIAGTAPPVTTTTTAPVATTTTAPGATTTTTPTTTTTVAPTTTTKPATTTTKPKATTTTTTKK